MQKNHEFPFIILATFIPLIFTTLWLLTNTQLPTSDATDFLTTGHSIYRHFTENGFLHGLWHFEIARGWRPIFFSVFTVPFLFVSHGSISFAYHAVAISCVLASAIYVYLLARLLLDRIPAVIATNLVVLLPFTQATIVTFFAEAALFPVVLGAIYHLIQSDYFREKKHTLGFIICFTLAIVIRPVEAITELLFILMVFLSAGWVQKIFSLKQIVTVMALGLSAVFLFLFYTSSHFLSHYSFHPIDGGIYDIKLAKSIYLSSKIVLFAMILAWAGLAAMNFSPWCRKRCVEKPLNHPPIIFVFSAIFILVLMWFLPHAFQTYTWIFRTSIGDLAANSISQTTMGKALQGFVLQEGLLLVAGVTLIALIAGVALGRQKLWKVFSSTPVIYLLLLIPFPLWEVLNTIQISARKLHLAFPALILVLLIIGLKRDRWFILRFSMAASLLVLQFIFALSFYFSPDSSLKKYAGLFGSYPQPVSLQPNPHDVVLDFVDGYARSHDVKHIALLVNPETALPVDPFLLSMMYHVKSLPYTMGSPYFSSYAESNLQEIRNDNDAAFLAGKSDEMQISKQAALAYYQRYQDEKNPAVKAVYRFLYYYSANKLRDIGWKSGPCMVVMGGDKSEYQGCMLSRTTI